MRVTIKKAGRLLLSGLLYFFLALCVLLLLASFFSGKEEGGAMTLLGYQLRLVTTDSMAACERTDVSGFAVKSIPARSMVFVQTVPEDPLTAESWYRALSVGDVLTFRYAYTSQVTITHRIVAIEENGMGGYRITLEGDNKNADGALLQQVIDTKEENSPNYVIGKVIGQSFLLGFLTSMLKTPVGLVFCIVVPCAVIILLEVIRIVSTVVGEKKKQQEKELLELRRELASLRQESKEDAASVQAEAPLETKEGEG